MFGFGYLMEAPFLRHSLATVRRWPFGMWAVVVSIVVLVLALIAHHLRLAYVARIDEAGQQSILGWYVIGIFGLPVALVAAGAAVIAVQNRSAGDGQEASRAPSETELTTDARAMESQASDEGVVKKEVRRPPWGRVSLHPHHWGIFYCLAFFTRWEDTVSNIGAGIILGIYLHGVAAYGHDWMIE
ncbi:hypothetical protein HK101_009295 [Irineochytrium annulatum]|nr:hypothetical protein HK101_009295 [Irineochytrium annulatum]